MVRRDWEGGREGGREGGKWKPKKNGPKIYFISVERTFDAYCTEVLSE